jgi:hypothetical protein
LESGDVGLTTGYPATEFHNPENQPTLTGGCIGGISCLSDDANEYVFKNLGK